MNGLLDIPEAFGLFSTQITPSLKEKLLESVAVASDEESEKEFNDADFRWMETKIGEDSPNKKPTVFINKKKFEEAFGEPLTQDQINKYILADSLHNLKNVSPETYKSLYDAAQNPEYLDWANQSYRYVTDPQNMGENVEKRPFQDWHDTSRFDQVVGGYLFGGDPDFPTMKEWNRDMPYGKQFKEELEKLRMQFGIK